MTNLKSNRRFRPPGHSLMEVVAAMVVATILVAGLGTVMMIGRQVAFTPSAPGHRMKASEIINQLASDLRYATLVIEQSPYVLDFVVADRNDDGVAERIRYQWSGTVGQPLTRSLNGAAPTTILEAVQEFQITPTTESTTTTLTTTATSAEVLLAANPNVLGGAPRGITNTDFSAQQINPAAFLAAAPAGALCWNATRAEFYAQKFGTYTGTLLVQLRRAGNPNNGPTSHVLGQVSIPENNLTATFGWNTATFASPITGLPLHRRFDLVFAGLGGSINDAQLYTNDSGGSGVLESSDAGASWQLMSSRQIFYRLYGTYSTAGTSYDVERGQVKHVRVMLRAGNQAHARVDARIPLLNAPELLSDYWRLDFDDDPTQTDADGDGTDDWAVAGGGSFDDDNLINGVWHASGALETRPLSDFTQNTTIEVRCRNTSVGGNGAVIRIHADRQGGQHAPLFGYLQLQADNTQTLTLYGKSADATNVQLAKCQGLPNDFVRIRLTIVPASNVVNLQINDEDQGTFTYPTYAPTTNDRFLTLFADTSAARFDYAEVRVAAP
jgi:hypothetical protein